MLMMSSVMKHDEATPTSGFFRGRGVGQRGRQQRWRGPSRSRSQGRGFQPQQQVKPNRTDENPPPSAAKPETETGFELKPKALSTSECALRNDPMWQDFDDDGFNGLTPYAFRNEFAITTEGFIGIAEREYDVLVPADWNFGKYISKSMFVWYLTMHLYARMIAIINHEDLNTFEEVRFLDYVRGNSYPVPAPIQEYLRSIGNARDLGGTEYHLVFPVWPNQHGHIDQVDFETHVDYESMPAPVVCAERIRQDLIYTIHPENDPYWNLPEDISPDEEDCGLPTKNLLGWSRAMALSTEQRQTLGAGVNEDDFGVTNVQFQMNKALFERVADFMRQAEKTIKLGSSVHESANGSVSQILWAERDVHVEVNFSRGEQYARREIRVCSNTQQDKRIAIGAMIMSFKVRKEQAGQRRSYSCYDFGNYLNVPDVWHETRKRKFVFGDVAVWNERRFASTFRGKDSLRTAWIRKSLVGKSRD
jgi:hypothetical protein